MQHASLANPTRVSVAVVSRPKGWALALDKERPVVHEARAALAELRKLLPSEYATDTELLPGSEAWHAWLHTVHDRHRAAAASVRALAANPHAALTLIANGGGESLLALLGTGDADLKCTAAETLATLAHRHGLLLFGRGWRTVLTPLLASLDPNADVIAPPKLRAHLARAIAALSRVSEFGQATARACDGAADVTAASAAVVSGIDDGPLATRLLASLLSLLEGQHEKGRAYAVTALANLTRHGPVAKAFGLAGGLQPLMELLMGERELPTAATDATSDELECRLVYVLGSVLKQWPVAALRVIRGGGFLALHALLASSPSHIPSSDLQVQVARALAYATVDVAACDAIPNELKRVRDETGHAISLSPILTLLHHANAEARAHTACLLANAVNTRLGPLLMPRRKELVAELLGLLSHWYEHCQSGAELVVASLSGKLTGTATSASVVAEWPTAAGVGAGTGPLSAVAYHATRALLSFARDAPTVRLQIAQADGSVGALLALLKLNFAESAEPAEGHTRKEPSHAQWTAGAAAALALLALLALHGDADHVGARPPSDSRHGNGLPPRPAAAGSLASLTIEDLEAPLITLLSVEGTDAAWHGGWKDGRDAAHVAALFARLLGPRPFSRKRSYIGEAWPPALCAMVLHAAACTEPHLDAQVADEARALVLWALTLTLTSKAAASAFTEVDGDVPLRELVLGVDGAQVNADASRVLDALADASGMGEDLVTDGERLPTIGEISEGDEDDDEDGRFYLPLHLHDSDEDEDADLVTDGERLPTIAEISEGDEDDDEDGRFYLPLYLHKGDEDVEDEDGRFYLPLYLHKDEQRVQL